MQFPVKGFALWRCATFEHRHNGQAVGLRFHFNPRQLRRSGQEIPEGPGLFTHAPGRHFTGPARDTGLAQSAFIEAALKVAQLAAHGLIKELADFRVGRKGRAIVTGENDERVVIHFEFLQQIHEATDLAVEARDHGSIGLLQLRPRLVLVEAKIVDLKTAMRQGDRVKKEEGAPCMLPHPVARVPADQVHGIGFAVQLDMLVVIPEIRREVAVCVTLAVVTIEVVEAELQRTARRIEHAHAPLAGAGRGITGSLEKLRHCHRSLRQRHLTFRFDLAICPDRAVPHVQAGHQR